MWDKIIFFIKNLNDKKAILILLSISFCLRLYAVLMAQGIPYDGAGYGFIARDFLKGDYLKGLSSPLHPLYPFLISLISPDTPYVEITGRLISLFFGTMALIPIYYLSKEVAGLKGATFSCLFYAFHPYLTAYSGMLLSEATYWCIFTLAVYFFWTGLKKGNFFRCIISGILLGLAYLTRPEGIGYLFTFWMWILFYGGLKRGWFKKTVLLGGVILPFVLFLIPYMIYIHQETGHWLISKKAIGVQLELLTLKAEGNILKEASGDKKNLCFYPLLYEMTQNILKNIPYTTYHFLRAYHFTLWIFLLFGLIRRKREGFHQELFVCTLILSHLFSLSIFSQSTIRYSVPIVPISLVWAGAGALEIRRILEKWRPSKSGSWVNFLIALVLIIQLPQILNPERSHRAEQKKVGLWLKKNTPKEAIIMSNTPQEVFYADREFLLLPQGKSGLSGLSHSPKSYDEIIQIAKEKGVKYILIKKNISSTNPGFKESIHSSDLKEKFKFIDKKGNVTIIYELLP